MPENFPVKGLRGTFFFKTRFGELPSNPSTSCSTGGGGLRETVHRTTLAVRKRANIHKVRQRFVDPRKTDRRRLAMITPPQFETEATSVELHGIPPYAVEQGCRVERRSNHPRP